MPTDSKSALTAIGTLVLAVRLMALTPILLGNSVVSSPRGTRNADRGHTGYRTIPNQDDRSATRVVGRYPAVVGGQQGCFDAAPDMQLCEDARHVVLDGFFGQVQAFTYLSIRQAFPDELQDLALTFGELWRSEFNRRGCARARPELYGAPVVPSRSHPGPSTRGRIGG